MAKSRRAGPNGHAPRACLRSAGEHSTPGPARPGSAPSTRAEQRHKPHVEVRGEVTVHYRFHPLAGCRVARLGHRSCRGEPILVVAAPDGRRYHLPQWMTAPEAAQWTLRDVPRLSLTALCDVRGLVATFLDEPVLPTGENDGLSTPLARATGPVRSTATEQPAAGPARGRAAGAGRPHDRVDPGAAHFRTLGTDS